MLDFDAMNDALIVGSAFAAADVPLLVELNVGAVVSLQSEAFDPVAELDRYGIMSARVGCEDFRAPSLVQIEQAVAAIDGFVLGGHRVYLHCYAGLQRAVTIAACFLVKSDPANMERPFGARGRLREAAERVSASRADRRGSRVRPVRARAARLTADSTARFRLCPGGKVSRRWTAATVSRMFRQSC